MRRSILRATAVVGFASAVAILMASGVTAASAASSVTTASTANAASVVTYPVPTSHDGLGELVLGSDGNMWFEEDHAIGRITSSGAITEYKLPSTLHNPQHLVLGSDGKIWFNADAIDGSSMRIANISTSGGYSVVSTLFASSDVLGPKVGRDGKIWLADFDHSTDTASLVAIAANGAVTKFAIPAAAGDFPVVTDLAFTSDGSVWYADDATHALGRMTAGGTFTRYPFADGESYATALVVAGNDNVLFTTETVPDQNFDYSGGYGLVTPAGVMTFVDNGRAVPSSAILGPDGNLWAATADISGASNGLIKVTSTGVATKFPAAVGASQILQLAAGQDGRIWFYASDIAHNRFGIGSASTSGAVSTYWTASRVGDYLAGLAFDGSGRAWFTDQGKTGADLVGNVVPVTSSRISGADRFATSVAVAKAGFPTTAPVVYVATGMNFPDALSAAAAASKEGGPLLLTAPTSLPASVQAEIQSLKPSKIVVVGGTSAISDGVFTALKKLAPTTVRIAGTDRYATSRAVVREAFGYDAPSAYVATALNYPDALSASAAAGALGRPVLLVKGSASTLDATSLAFVKSLGAKSFRIAGGTAAVSSGIESALKGVGSVSRSAGATRYATSELINRAAFTKPMAAYFATGVAFPDALSGAALAGATKDPLYVVQPGCVPAATVADLSAASTSAVTLIGGTSALSAGTAALTSCG